MASKAIQQIAGTAVYVPGDDIDTDRIIPARFMKCITFDGLGEYLFYDVRKAEDGTDKAHNLNDPRYAGASVLISGNNFGCGSSREHAPQAILRAGFEAVIAGSFAEIFFGNATNLGVVCVTAADADRESETPAWSLRLTSVIKEYGGAISRFPVTSSRVRGTASCPGPTTRSTN